MALNIEMLKQPKYLVIGGVAVVGGIYFASKLNSRKRASSNDAPIEVPTAIQSVTSTDSLNASDELQRKLAEAEAKQNDLLKQQEQQQKDYQQNLADYQLQFEDERSQYQTRLQQLGTTLGNQYGAQIASLQAMIKNLQGQILGKNTGPLKPSTPSTPDKTRDTKQQAIYPGVSSPDIPENADRSLLGSYDAVVANQKRKGQSTTFTVRNMLAISIYGTPTPWVGTGTWNLPEAINQRRVHYSLRPLTKSEIDSMLRDVAAYDRQYHDHGSYEQVRSLFDKWNAPYQSQSVKRF